MSAIPFGGAKRWVERSAACVCVWSRALVCFARRGAIIIFFTIFVSKVLYYVVLFLRHHSDQCGSLYQLRYWPGDLASRSAYMDMHMYTVCRSIKRVTKSYTQESYTRTNYRVRQLRSTAYIWAYGSNRIRRDEMRGVRLLQQARCSASEHSAAHRVDPPLASLACFCACTSRGHSSLKGRLRTRRPRWPSHGPRPCLAGLGGVAHSGGRGEWAWRPAVIRRRRRRRLC